MHGKDYGYFYFIWGFGRRTAKTKGEREKEHAAAANGHADGNFDLDKDIEDLSASVQDDTSKKQKTRSKNKEKNVEVEAPVTCIGDHFRVTLEDVHTVRDCVNQLVGLGYREILVPATCVPVGKRTLFFHQTTSGTPENRRVDLPVSICAGENRMELTSDDFPHHTPDEISVEMVLEKWVANNPAYEGCRMTYEPKCAVAAPVMPEKAVNKKKEYELPMKLSLFGEVLTITNEDLGRIGPVTVEMIEDYLYLEYSLDLEGTEILLRDSGEMVFVQYGCKRKDKGISYSREDHYVKAEAELKDIVEKYALPLTLYMANFNYSVPLTADDFGGRNKVERADILKIAVKYCPTLSSADRRADVLYLKEKHIVSVAAVSGIKGA